MFARVCVLLLRVLVCGHVGLFLGVFVVCVCLGVLFVRMSVHVFVCFDACFCV